MSNSTYRSNYSNIGKEFQVIRLERHIAEAKSRLQFCEKYNSTFAEEFKAYIITAEKELKALKGEQ